MKRNFIEIKTNDFGQFDVLINGVSYKIHRNLSADDANKRAAEIKAEFTKMHQKSGIVRK